MNSLVGVKVSWYNSLRLEQANRFEQKLSNRNRPESYLQSLIFRKMAKEYEAKGPQDLSQMG